MRRTFRLALLQHVGCTVAAAPVAAIMGDEQVMRAHAATLDFTGLAEMFRFLLAHVARANPPLDRPAALAWAAAGGRRTLGTMADLCEGVVRSRGSGRHGELKSHMARRLVVYAWRPPYDRA
jgi:hypothetical protein